MGEIATCRHQNQHTEGAGARWCSDCGKKEPVPLESASANSAEKQEQADRIEGELGVQKECAIDQRATRVAADEMSHENAVEVAPQQAALTTLTLDAKAVEALDQYLQALQAFQAVGHGTDDGANLYLAAERAAEDLGKRIAVLAASANEAKLDELAVWSPEDYPAGSEAYWCEVEELGERHLLNQQLNLIKHD